MTGKRDILFFFFFILKELVQMNVAVQRLTAQGLYLHSTS